MGHFAKVEDGKVVQVIVAEQDFIDSGAVGDKSLWVQTSYNTHGGVHKNGGTALRKNYAGIGFDYDATKDAFIPPKPYASWLLNDETCLWEAPVPYPTDSTEEDPKSYVWDEESVNWKLVEQPSV